MKNICVFVFISAGCLVAGCGGSDGLAPGANPPDVDAAVDASDDAPPTRDGDVNDEDVQGSDGGGGAKVGDPCSSADSCPAGGSGSPACLTDWPGGYCAVEGCEQHGHDCPEDPGLGAVATTGSQCVLAPSATCLALCGNDDDCRPDYACTPKPDAAGHGTATVCVPRSEQPAADAGMSDGGMGEGGMDADGGMMGGDGGM